MVGMPGMALVMQATQAPVVPVAPQGSVQAANPSPIAGIIMLAWLRMKLKIETRHSVDTPPLLPLSPLLSPSLSSVVLLLLLLEVLRESRGLARASGLS